MNKKKYMFKLPCLRYRKRYILFKIYPESLELNYSQVEKVILDSLLRYMGEQMLSRASVWIMKENYVPEVNMGVIRCRHDYVSHIIAALSLVNSIDGNRARIDVLSLSGSIKKIKKKMGELNADNDTGNDGI